MPENSRDPRLLVQHSPGPRLLPLGCTHWHQLDLYLHPKIHVGGCQNYVPFLDPYYNTAPNIWGTQKRDHIVDNHPRNPHGSRLPAPYTFRSASHAPALSSADEHFRTCGSTFCIPEATLPIVDRLQKHQFVWKPA